MLFQSLLLALTNVAVVCHAHRYQAFDGPGNDDHGRRPCGLKIAPCPSGQQCTPNDPSCSDVWRCPGTCDYKSCGGKRPVPVFCDEGAECIDDARKGGCGMACDAPGICVSKMVPSCGGFAGRPCPRGLKCYDKPNDGCDPKKGGADCPGICL